MKKAIVNFGKPVRAMKPQHCLSWCSPVTGYNIPEMYEEMEESKLYTRIFENCCGNGKSVNIPYIFRDFAADAQNPNAYYFPQTDTVMEQAADVGAKIIYTLGGPREITLPRIYCTVPTDFEKWADVCVNIIRHYTEGWANGFHYNVEYWEIWNEPDNPVFWENGTMQQYFELYACTAKKIKALNPSLKVGGPALALLDESGLIFAEKFLAYVKENNLPLDFFSYHAVNQSVDEIVYRAERIQQIVAESGLQVELIQDGWNCIDEHGDERTRFDHNRDAQGTAYGAAIMAVMQANGVDASLNYDLAYSSQYSNLMNWFGDIEKPYYSLKAYKKVYDLGTEVESKGYGVYITAARNGEKAAILVTNYDAETTRCEILFKEFGPCKAEYYTLDETRDLEKTKEEIYDADGMLAVQLRGYAAVLIQLEAV